MEKFNGLVELVYWWFLNQKVWFDSTELNDIDITNKFEYLMDINWDIDWDFMTLNKEIGIGYIILYDQITRHIARVKKSSFTYISEHLSKIIKFIDLFYPIHKNNLNGNEFCFVLLPYRHSNIFSNQTFVMNQTWEKILNSNQNEKSIKIYKKYLEATYKRASNGITYKSIWGEIISSNKISYFTNHYRDILDVNCISYTNDDVLTIDILSSSNPNILKIINTCKNLNQNKTKRKYILSISGGVDSMVMSFVLAQLSIDFVMVHINYANREEICEREKKLLANWANFIKKDLYFRDIYEINRPKCMALELRNLYENYTKNVRYHTYIDTYKQNSCDELNECFVLMGHNHDDCIENILTNITNKSKYSNLIGMKFESTITFRNFNINFIRPFLTISKSSIYEFAHNFKIPYLVDSTPKWSQRGMIRDIVRPALIQWNKRSLEGLDELTIVMKESLECLDLLVSYWINRLQPYNTLDNTESININTLSQSNRFGYGVIKLSIDEISSNKIFWRRLFEMINIQISSKTLNELTNRFIIMKKKFCSLQIKQPIQIQINQQNKLVYWKIHNNKIIIGFN